LCDHPLVSVIVINYNGVSLLDDCFTSLKNLSCPSDSVELIMVDNGSTDRSVLFMREHFRDVKIIENKKNLGFAEPNNMAASMAKGKYLAFLNNDMRVRPDWLLKLIEAIKNSPDDVICVGSKILNWHGEQVQFGGAGMAFDGRGFEVSSLRGSEESYPPVLFACGGAMLIKRDIFIKLGGFDPKYFAYFEDVDLGWRLWITGYRVLLVPDSIVYHHHQKTGNAIFSLEQKIFLGERNCFYSMIKNYEDKNLAKLLPAVIGLRIKKMLIHSKMDRRDWIAGKDFTGKKGPAICDIIKDFIQNIKSEGFSYIFRRKYNILPYWLERIVTKHYVLTPRPSMGPFIALEDLMEDLDYLFEKRDFIQSQRKRSDREIFRLFLDPFNCQYDEEEYVKVRNSIIKNLKLTEMFLSEDGER